VAQVNRHIVPGFYRYLQAQEEKSQIEHGEELKEQISKLVDAADKSGPFFLGDKMTFVDVQVETPTHSTIQSRS
jgi:hypothetical protein